MPRLTSCNILSADGEVRHLWQFDAGKFSLNREQHLPPNQPLPPGLVGKSWSALWQTRLNIAWLPGDRVFLRAVQLPKADLEETRSMVEFQLEKLSPLPVTQVVWGFHVLPHPPSRTAEPATGEAKVEDLQTVIVVVVARDVVEEFLGRLEKDGFMADRLEVPLLDRLLAATPAEDGAWIYLGERGIGETALVAWWQRGVLESLGLVQMPTDRTQTAALAEQLSQMTWAGELEGWLSGTPQWHIVTSTAQGQEWRAVFEQATGSKVTTVTAPGTVELAAATARRSVRTSDSANLLPAEYTKRYHEQFFDRLWLRGLMSIGVLYVAGVIVYFIALQVLVFQTRKVEDRVVEIGGSYTNAIQLKARYKIMKERQELKFAALDCWKTTADLLPQGATLESLDFRDGSKLSLRGTAPSTAAVQLSDFNAAMKKAKVGDQPLFAKVEGLTYNQGPNNTISWNFSCDLNHVEANE